MDQTVVGDTQDVKIAVQNIVLASLACNIKYGSLIGERKRERKEERKREREKERERERKKEKKKKEIKRQ